MIISDLNYLEVTTEASTLKGGVDAAFNFTAFQEKLSMMQTGTTSGPGGSGAFTNAQHLEISTIGLSGIILGA